MISSKSPRHDSTIDQMDWSNEKVAAVAVSTAEPRLTALFKARTEVEVKVAWESMKQTHPMAQLIHMPGVMHFLHQCTKGELWPECWGCDIFLRDLSKHSLTYFSPHRKVRPRRNLSGGRVRTLRCGVA